MLLEPPAGERHRGLVEVDPDVAEPAREADAEPALPAADLEQVAGLRRHMPRSSIPAKPCVGGQRWACARRHSGSAPCAASDPPTAPSPFASAQKRDLTARSQRIASDDVGACQTARVDARAVADLEDYARLDRELAADAARLRDLDTQVAAIRAQGEAIDSFFARYGDEEGRRGEAGAARRPLPRTG